MSRPVGKRDTTHEKPQRGKRRSSSSSGHMSDFEMVNNSGSESDDEWWEELPQGRTPIHVSFVSLHFSCCCTYRPLL